MTIKQTIIAAALAFLCSIALLPSTAVAHHGVTGQFDLDQTLTVTGIMNRVRFVNPHRYVYFKVTNDAGTQLTREYTIVDPVYLSQSHSHQNSSVLTNADFIPYDCYDLTIDK